MNEPIRPKISWRDVVLYSVELDGTHMHWDTWQKRAVLSTVQPDMSSSERWDEAITEDFCEALAELRDEDSIVNWYTSPDGDQRKRVHREDVDWSTFRWRRDGDAIG